MRVDWLVVGAGLTGATLAERIASQLGQKVLVVDRRRHVGGNVYDEYDESGILVHKYGPHIFRTNNEKVWKYLSHFTDWRPYYHRVLGVVEGKKVPIPFNLNSLDALFPSRHAERFAEKLLRKYGFGAEVPILSLMRDEDEDIRGLARYVYEGVFYGYTTKQWGMKPEDLDASVTGRIPIRVSRDDRYFKDRYQAIPSSGYTVMVRRMLAHPNIKVLLGADYREVAPEVDCERMVFTGAIDEFFDYRHGPLPYRSLRFEFATLRTEWFQEVATVNYPNEFDFTRITEAKYLSGQRLPMTVLTYEYPEPYIPGENEPYYPIPQAANRERYELYLEDARQLLGRVVFAGRLARYTYCDMAQAVASALDLWERISHE